MAIRMMLVGVDTFSLTLNKRLRTENELRRGKRVKMRNETVGVLCVLLPYQISTPLPATALKTPPITPTKTVMDKKSCRKSRKIIFKRFALT